MARSPISLRLMDRLSSGGAVLIAYWLSCLLAAPLVGTAPGLRYPSPASLSARRHGQAGHHDGHRGRRLLRAEHIHLLTTLSTY